MSANDTDPQEEEKKHKPAMNAIRLSIFAGVAILVVVVGTAFMRGGAPEGAETQIEPGVGTEPVAE